MAYIVESGGMNESKHWRGLGFRHGKTRGSASTEKGNGALESWWPH